MGKFVLGNCNVSLRSCANRKKESERVNRASGESRHSLAPRDMGQGSPGRRYGGLSTPAWGPKPGHALPDQADAGVLGDAGPGRPATGTATAVGALLPGRDRVDHRLDALYLCLGQYSVAKVEDVAGAPAHGFQKADRLSPRQSVSAEFGIRPTALSRSDNDRSSSPFKRNTSPRLLSARSSFGL